LVTHKERSVRFDRFSLLERDENFDQNVHFQLDIKRQPQEKTFFA